MSPRPIALALTTGLLLTWPAASQAGPIWPGTGPVAAPARSTPSPGPPPTVPAANGRLPRPAAGPGLPGAQGPEAAPVGDPLRHAAEPLAMPALPAPIGDPMSHVTGAFAAPALALPTAPVGDVLRQVTGALAAPVPWPPPAARADLGDPRDPPALGLLGRATDDLPNQPASARAQAAMARGPADHDTAVPDVLRNSDLARAIAALRWTLRPYVQPLLEGGWIGIAFGGGLLLAIGALRRRG